MLFSQTAEYALRAVVCLAADPDRAMTTAELARTTRVPANYLSKLMQTLRRAGLVDAQRGVGGGFTLTRTPAEISVLDVIQVVDPIERIDTCPLGIESHGRVLCPMHRKLDDALAHIQHTFSESSIQDLLDSPGASRPLCETPSQTPLHLSVRGVK